MRFCHRFPSWIVLLVTATPCILISQTIPLSENVDSLFFSAQRLQRAGDLKAAKLRARAVLSRTPDYHDARVLYGRLLAWEGEYQPALVQFDSVLTANPEHEEAKLAKAQVLSWMKRYRQSSEVLQSLLEKSPQSSIYLAELGRVYWLGGAPRRGLELYEKAYLQDPLSEDVIRGLARIHRQLKSHDLSLSWYRKLLARVPKDPEALSEVFRQTYRAENEIMLQGTWETFAKPGFSDHQLATLEYYRSVSEDWKPYLHIGRIAKFSKEDNRIGVGSYFTISYSTSFLSQLLISPGADIAPRVEALGECSYGFGEGIEGVAGYRFLSFDSTQVHILSPGVTGYIDQDVWLTPRVYVGLGDGMPASISWTFTIHYRLSMSALVRVGGFSGNETFRANTLSEISTLKSAGGFLSLKERFASTAAVEAVYQFTSRNISSNSHLLTLTISLLF